MKVPSLMMFVVELFGRKVFDMPCMGPAGVTGIFIYLLVATNLGRSFAPPIRSYMYVVASSSKFLASRRRRCPSSTPSASTATKTFVITTGTTSGAPSARTGTCAATTRSAITCRSTFKLPWEKPRLRGQ